MALEAGKLSVFKLASFAIIYGLLPINWVDLFNPALPGYHIWLTIMYMAPFALVVLMEGFSLVPLALSLGLLASLMNDLFYYPVGDLFFGMKVDRPVLVARPARFRQASTASTLSRAASLRFDVTSMILGASVYLRIFIVAFLLYKWSHRTQAVESAAR